MRLRRSAVALLLSLSGACLGGKAEAQETRMPEANPPSILVDGSAMREVAPDLAVISLGVTTERPTAADASAQNNKAATALIAAIRASGLSDADIETTQVSLAPVLDSHDSAKTNGFQATNHVAIRIHDLATVGDTVGRLIDKGANQVEGIDFMVSNPQPVLDGLRGDATRDALHKARIFADAAGVKLGRILEILPEDIAGAPLQRAFKTQMAMAAMSAPPVQSGMQALESRVRIRLELVP